MLLLHAAPVIERCRQLAGHRTVQVLPALKGFGARPGTDGADDRGVGTVAWVCEFGPIPHARVSNPVRPFATQDVELRGCLSGGGGHSCMHRALCWYGSSLSMTSDDESA